jgi:hypothetical protein
MLIQLTPDEARAVSGALEVGAEGAVDAGMASEAGARKALEIAAAIRVESRITLAVGEAN